MARKYCRPVPTSLVGASWSLLTAAQGETERRPATISVFILLWALVFVSSIQAQSPVLLRGQVADETGAVIRGARVTLIAVDGKKRSVVTNGNGEFAIPNVAPGHFTLTVEFKGFQTHIENDLQVSAASPSLEITLTVAAVNIETEVKGEASRRSKEKLQVCRSNPTRT